MMGVRPGQLVTSRAGRDKGQDYLVLAVMDEWLALVADGERRKVRNPKKKNVKHLWILDKQSPEIAGKLENGMAVTDEEIRAALRDLKERQGGG